MLTFPLKTNRGDTVGVLQLINEKNAKARWLPFSKKDEPLVMHFANMAAVRHRARPDERAMILRTIKMAELRDPKETGAHVTVWHPIPWLSTSTGAGKRRRAP